MSGSTPSGKPRIAERDAVSLEPDFFAFTVEGKAVGYYTMGARPNWDRMNAYHQYKQHVQWAAKANGLKLPLRATEAQPVKVTTRLFAATRVHHDPENVQKAVVDSLFYGAKGGDKHVGGSYSWATYGQGERVEIEIKWPNGRAEGIRPGRARD